MSPGCGFTMPKKRSVGEMGGTMYGHYGTLTDFESNEQR
jgi:hypothetical protein